MIKNGTADRLPDGGKKLRASLDAVCRALMEARPQHPDGGVPEASAQDEKGKGCKRVVRSRGAKSSGMARDSKDGKVTKADFMVLFGKDEQEELCADNSANMEKISSDGHNKICTPAVTPSRKRKGDASDGFSRLRSRKGEVVLVDGDIPHAESAERTSNRDARKLYYPSREHPSSVEISSDDMKCLEPESLLTSPIMNFYIMYLQGSTSSTARPKGDYHIFNTFFFNKLKALGSKEEDTTYFLKLRRWWKGIDIFQKSYLLLPVHADTHWSLVIICMPAKDDQTGPVILHLDSLKFHSSMQIFDVVSRFLKKEWSYLNENASLTELPLQETVWKNFPRKIEKKRVEVPQQENEYDCGVFALYNMQRFILEAPERLYKKDLSMFGKRWFQPEEATQLRLEISRLILSCGEAEPNNDATELLYVEAEPKNGPTEPSCVEAEPKNDATGQSCGEAELKNDAVEPTSEVLTGAVEVAATKLHASGEVTISCD